MIRINDDYVILVDSRNYTLAKDMHKEIKRQDGKMIPYYKELSYHTRLENALDALGRVYIAESLQDDSRSLYEAIQCIREAINKLDETIKKNVPDFEVIKK